MPWIIETEIRAVLPLNGFWFAPFSSETGKIDPNIVSVGEHRDRLARRNIKAWLQSVGLPYHSPHKFRHGHIHFGNTHANNIEDFKAVSMNVMHSSMKITDEFYSNINDDGVGKKISALRENTIKSDDNREVLNLLHEFIEWRRATHVM